MMCKIIIISVNWSDLISAEAMARFCRKYLCWTIFILWTGFLIRFFISIIFPCIFPTRISLPFGGGGLQTKALYINVHL